MTYFRAFTFAVVNPTTEECNLVRKEFARRLESRALRHAICGLATDALGVRELRGFYHSRHAIRECTARRVHGLARARISGFINDIRATIDACRLCEGVEEWGTPATHVRRPVDSVSWAMSSRRPAITPAHYGVPRWAKPKHDLTPTKEPSDGFEDMCRLVVSTQSLVVVPAALMGRRRYDFEQLARIHFNPFEGERNVIWVWGDREYASQTARGMALNTRVPFYWKRGASGTHDDYRCESVAVIDEWWETDDVSYASLSPILEPGAHRVDTSSTSLPWMAQVVIVIAPFPPHDLSSITELIKASPALAGFLTDVEAGLLPPLV